MLMEKHQGLDLSFIFDCIDFDEDGESEAGEEDFFLLSDAAFVTLVLVAFFFFCGPDLSDISGA